MAAWQWYRCLHLTQMRPYEVGEDLTGVRVAAEDTPGPGGMIARDIDNPAEQLYVNVERFQKYFEVVAGATTADD